MLLKSDFMRVSKFILVAILIVSFTLLSQSDILAQCPMCRMSAESNLNNGGTAGKGLNNGILYIFAMPYLLIGVIGYIWWKNNKKNKALENQID